MARRHQRYRPDSRSSFLSTFISIGSRILFTSTHSKIGNDGSVSCDIYCTHDYSLNDTYMGSCVAAHLKDASKTWYSCFGVPHTSVACLCAQFQ